MPFAATGSADPRDPGAPVSHQPDNARRDLLACVVVLAAAYLATWPFTNTGVLDDWSYIRTALDLSSSGELRYNGWASPMIGAQAWLGAASVRLFGPSLIAVRVSTLPIAVGTALLLRALLRLAGVRSLPASLGALAFGLSPLVIPLATSFMTDLPALAGGLLCALALVHSSRQAELRPAIGYLLVAFVGGALGASVRQTAWLAPIAMLACFAAFECRRPRLGLVALGLAAASVLLAVAAVHWRAAQPYVVELKSLGDAVLPVLHGLPRSVQALLPLLYSILALVLPLSVCRIAGEACSGDTAMRIRLGVAAVVAAITAPMLLSSSGSAPWLDNLLSRTGLVGAGMTVIGEGQLTLAPAVQQAIALASYASMPLLVATMRSPFRRDGATQCERLVVALLASSAVAYAAMMALFLFRATSYDRYVIPLLPFAIVLLLRRRSGAMPAGVMAMGAVLVTLWGFYGIAITHDMFAALRARREAFDQLRARGVPATSICGGFEIDGLTQIDAAGFVAHPAVRRPPEVRASYRRRTDLALPFWFLNHAPSIQPRWWITLSPVSGFLEEDLPVVEYVRWLPPGHNRIHVIRTP
ncbi:MAG TPA: hypothetical protein VN634_06355 [Candidatus Limnocylindrales bacterium]|nr:hypothetical protein [Candidatus Limnocylindrales bacterium]